MKKSLATTVGSSFRVNYPALSFLIVDDQPFTRRIIRSILAGFGSREIYESANGVEALELARNAMPSIIITDLVMPDSNGMKLIGMLKAPESPVRKIPIVVLSGYLTKTTAISIMESGADELLVKPVAPKALHEHISRIIARRDKTGATTAPGATTSPASAVRQRITSGGGPKSKAVAYL